MELRKGWIGTVTAFVTLGLLLTAGCSGKSSEEKMAEDMARKMIKQNTGKDVDVKMQGGKIEFKGQDFKSEIAETSAWPSDMFSEVPQFTFAKIERVVKANEGGLQKFNIYYKDLKSDGINQYAEILKKNGWQANIMQMGDKGGYLNAQKGKLGMNFAFSLERKDGRLAVYTTP
jgi:hypothetical protein